ncbi:MAG TPA: hypothetical protein VFD32_15390 [Dehalococcoidia bacterium]|nr:hypothetical protein [Dehalococcoidia bacterium]
MGALAIDPTNPNIIYAGEGGAPFAFRNLAPGTIGLLKSTDGGNSWSVVAGTAAFNSSLAWYGLSFARIVLDPTGASGCGGGLCRLYAATGFGLYRSADGGVSWTLVAGGVNPQDPTSNVYPVGAVDVVLDTAVSPAKVYAGIGTGGGDFVWGGVWISTDGAHFTQQTLANAGLPSRQDAGIWPGTISLAIDPRAHNTVYAFFGHGQDDPAHRGDSSFLGLYKTTDGTHWQAAANPAINCQFGSPSGPCHDSYEWFNNSLAVDPTNSDVIVALTNVWRSSDGGQSWVSRTNGAAGTSGTHVDQHALQFVGQRLFVGNDGGIWSTSNDGDAWTDLNHGGLVLTEFYPGSSIAPYDSSLVIAGSQDNGVEFEQGSPFTQPSAWNWIGGGDGQYIATDPRGSGGGANNTWYFSAQNLLGFVRLDHAGTASQVYTGITGNLDTSGANWNAPFLIDQAHPDRMIVGTQYVYGTGSVRTGVPVWSRLSQPVVAGSDTISALAFADGDQTGNTLYAGTTEGRMFTSTSGLTPANWTDITGNLPAGGRQITSITTDGLTPPTVFVTTNGFGPMHVARLSPGTSQWVDISAPLPNAPASRVRAVGAGLYVATDVGVYVSGDGGTSWQVVGQGLPAVQVLDLQYEPATNSLVAFTFGRGAWVAQFGGVTATDAWASDGGSDWSVHKTVFNAGDPVRYVGAVSNPNAEPAPATLTWNVTGPAGQIAGWSGSEVTETGAVWWGLARTIPTNACSAGAASGSASSGGDPPEPLRPGTPGRPITPQPEAQDAVDGVWAATDATPCTYTFQFSVTSNGITTTHSSTFQVQPSVTAPGTPTLTAPPEGATDVSVTPTISWTAPSGAISGTTQYTAYVWDPAASAMKFQQTTTALSVTVPASAGLVSGHFYYMSVQACNGSACGPLARWEGFTTKNSLGAPVLTSPAEGATGVSLTPTLSWTAASGATASTQYTAYIWDPSAGAMAFQATSSGLSVSVPAAQALHSLHFYYYSAVACDGGSCGPLARWEGFTTKSSGNAPGAPGLTAPAEGATNVSRTPTLQWTAPSGAVSGTTQYTAYIWDPNAGAMAWQGTTTQLSITVPSGSPLAAGHFFYYSAQACNGSLCGPNARWEGFTTIGGLIAPALIAPREGATGVGTTPTFQWGAVTGNGSTVFYTLYVWDPQASVMRYQTTTAQLTATVPAGSALVSGHFYYYSVQACDSSGCGPLARWEGFTS